jgi:hypothetical protein
VVDDFKSRRSRFSRCEDLVGIVVRTDPTRTLRSANYSVLSRPVICSGMRTFPSLASMDLFGFWRPLSFRPVM